MVLNEDFNEWYRTQLRKFIQENDVKHHPERMDDFKLDLTQLKVNAVQITDDELCRLNISSHLQTGADILCIGRQTYYENLKREI